MLMPENERDREEMLRLRDRISAPALVKGRPALSSAGKAAPAPLEPDPILRKTLKGFSLLSRCAAGAGRIPS